VYDVNSIREFCDLSMPIFMFDKNGDFVVMKLEMVCIMLLRGMVCTFREHANTA
jgi:hypothetical protein